MNDSAHLACSPRFLPPIKGLSRFFPHRLVGLFLISGLLVSAGCSGARWPWSDDGDSQPAAAPPPAIHRIYRGTLILGGSVRSFTPCGEDRAIWAVDETGGLLAGIYSELTGGAGAIYAEVRGSMSEPPADKAALGYEATLTITELVRADPLGESDGCAGLRPGVDFRAWGNEPFWSIEMGPRTIALRQPEEPTFRIYPPALPNVQKDKVVFTSTSAMNVRDQIRITLEPVPCRDTMSGAYASWTATVEIDGRTLRGCAVQGWGS